jgi:DNA-directed RNA polymerase subunit F
MLSLDQRFPIKNMSQNPTKETTGAWIIHHGHKVAMDARGPADFSAIDEASKAAGLLIRLGETDQTTLETQEVQAVARIAGINPRSQLQGLLSILEEKRLINRAQGGISILGVTTKSALSHAADFFTDANPSNIEYATITLAEVCSKEPLSIKEATEYISDIHKLTIQDTREFLTQAQQIGFIDSEGDGEDKLLFNGNLFR